MIDEILSNLKEYVGLSDVFLAVKLLNLARKQVAKKLQRQSINNQGTSVNTDCTAPVSIQTAQQGENKKGGEEVS